MQIELLVRGWKGDVGPLAWLDAPDQFPNYVLSTDGWRRLAAVAGRRALPCDGQGAARLPSEDACILPKPPRWNQARIPLPKAARRGGYAGCGLPSFCCSTISCAKLSHWIFALQFIQLTFKRLELRRNSLEQDGRLNSEIFMRQNVSHPDHLMPRNFRMRICSILWASRII